MTGPLVRLPIFYENVLGYVKSVQLACVLLASYKSKWPIHPLLLYHNHMVIPEAVCIIYHHTGALMHFMYNLKVEVKSVLRIGSAHNNVRTSNVRTSNVNIAQISNVSNFSEHKPALFHIHLEA
jgi:hypothetical protein